MAVLNRSIAIFTVLQIGISCKDRYEQSDSLVLGSRAHELVMRDQSPSLLAPSEVLSLFSSNRVLRVDGSDGLPPHSDQSDFAKALRKFDSLVKTPFVSNDAYRRGGIPTLPSRRISSPHSQREVRSLKVVQWNVLYGTYVNEIAQVFKRQDELRLRRSDEAKKVKISEQLEAFDSPDIILLNEADWGLSRSGYRSIPEELGNALQMNWAYGVDFLEIDNFQTHPSVIAELDEFITRIPNEKITIEYNKRIHEAYANWFGKVRLDEEKFKGLTGNVILSKYPIIRAELIPLEESLQDPVYDWLRNERKNISVLEYIKRSATKWVFDSERIAQIRYGKTNMLLVDLWMPGSPTGVVRVASVHPEAFCAPIDRRRQMQAYLQILKNRDLGEGHPLILAGDLNTHAMDASPDNVASTALKTVSNLQFITRSGLSILQPGVGLGLGLLNSWKQYHSPNAPSIWLVMENPERKLFDLIESHRFKDGIGFDTSGPNRGFFRATDWGYSNQQFNIKTGALTVKNRGKGFVPTFETNATPLGMGELKLDWMFVKPAVSEFGGGKSFFPIKSVVGRELNASVIVAPESIGNNVQSKNAVNLRISDHHPIMTYVQME